MTGDRIESELRGPPFVGWELPIGPGPLAWPALRLIAGLTDLGTKPRSCRSCDRLTYLGARWYCSGATLEACIGQRHREVVQRD